MSRRYGPWPEYIRSHFVRQIDLYAAVLRDRLLPAFESINEEANTIEQEKFERLCSSSSEDLDIASLGETARDEAVDFLVMMWRMKQAQINLQTVGLYHLFEQQLFELHRRQEFYLAQVKPNFKVEWPDVTTALLTDGIDIETLPVAKGERATLRRELRETC